MFYRVAVCAVGGGHWPRHLPGFCAGPSGTLGMAFLQRFQHVLGLPSGAGMVPLHSRRREGVVHMGDMLRGDRCWELVLCSPQGCHALPWGVVGASPPGCTPSPNKPWC